MVLFRLSGSGYLATGRYICFVIKYAVQADYESVLLVIPPFNVRGAETT